MTIEFIPLNPARSRECKAIKEAILKSVEGLRLDPVSLAEQLMAAFDKVNEHYGASGEFVTFVCPHEFKYTEE